MTAQAASPVGGRRALPVWATAVSVYFLAVFHRSSLGVAGLTAAERFDISASQLSTFTVLQLAVYAAMQIPVGVLLDRFGPQRLLFSGAVVMTLAQLGFAYTGSFAGALVARVFVGMGDAMVFISVLRIIASWFPPRRNPVMTAWTALLGQCGALVAAIPLARSLARFGWTPTFVASGVVGLVLGILVVLLVRDVPPGAPPSRTVKDVRTVGRDLKLAWLDPGTRLGLWSHFTAQFGSNVMGLLWGYPFFVHSEHTGTGAAGGLLSLLVVTMIVGGPLVGGFIARHPWQRSTVVLSIVAAMMVTWAFTLLWPGDAPLWLLAAHRGRDRPRRPRLDGRLRRGAHLRAGVPARLRDRHRQRRRLLRLAGGGLLHRGAARRVHPRLVDRLHPARLHGRHVGAVRRMGARRDAGVALPAPGPPPPAGDPAGRPRGVDPPTLRLTRSCG